MSFLPESALFQKFVSRYGTHVPILIDPQELHRPSRLVVISFSGAQRVGRLGLELSHFSTGVSLLLFQSCLDYHYSLRKARRGHQWVLHWVDFSGIVPCIHWLPSVCLVVLVVVVDLLHTYTMIVILPMLL
jgi:hypothetical protein